MLKDIDAKAFTSETAGSRKDSRTSRRRTGLIGSLAVVIFIAWAIWSWGFWRFYVGPGEMAIITSKYGADLESGQILARPGQKGVLENVLGEGRHLWNPLFYTWEIVDAQFIPPGKVGIVTAKTGTSLPDGEFLADPGQKGIRRQVLGPGCHRLNPYGYNIEIIDAFSIPVGFAGVVTNKSGKPIEKGAFAGVGEQGIRSVILQPGIYYLNPYEFAVDIVEVGVNQVSLVGDSGAVVLSKNVVLDENNQMIQRLNQNVLMEQRRRIEMQNQVEDSQNESHAYGGRSRSAIDGVMNDPGQILRNTMSRTLPTGQAPGAGQGRVPDMEKYVPPEFVLDKFVEFPSRDGFKIRLDMTVEFELPPDKLAAIRRDDGFLPDVVNKVIMQGIVPTAQNTGSTYRAVDFIAGAGREKFQNDLTETLKASFTQWNILVHGAFIRNVNVPEQILEPLQATSLSRETNLTNLEKQNTAKKQAELNREMSLIKQSGEQIMQETDKLKAQIAAEMKKTVAMIHADTGRQLAALEKETASVRASKTVAIGQAEASSVQMVGEEKAKGFGMKIKAFGSDGGEYALYEFAMKLNPNMKINLIHAGEGTLWTDLKNTSMAEIGGAAAMKRK